MFTHRFQAHTEHFVENILWLMDRGTQKNRHFKTDKSEKDFHVTKKKRKISAKSLKDNYNFCSDRSKNKFNTVN